MASAFHVFIEWLIHESDSDYDPSYFEVTIREDDTALSLVDLAHVNRFAYKRLCRFYRPTYKKDVKRWKRYQKVTMWYDALNELDLSDIPKHLLEPMASLKRTESEIIRSRNCQYCKYIVCVDMHDMYCDGDYACEFCIAGTPPCYFMTCECSPIRLTTDGQFCQLLRQYMPRLIEQGWEMASDGGLQLRDDVLSYSEEKSLEYINNPF